MCFGFQIPQGARNTAYPVAKLYLYPLKAIHFVKPYILHICSNLACPRVNKSYNFIMKSTEKSNPGGKRNLLQIWEENSVKIWRVLSDVYFEPGFAMLREDRHKRDKTSARISAHPTMRLVCWVHRFGFKTSTFCF